MINQPPAASIATRLIHSGSASLAVWISRASKLPAGLAGRDGGAPGQVFDHRG